MLYNSKKAGRYEPIPSNHHAGVTVTDTTRFTAGADLAANDVIEMTALPADAQLVAATLISTGAGAVTSDLGFSSTPFADADQAKTGGNELLDDAAASAGAAPLATCIGIAPTDQDRGISITVNGAISAGATFTIVLQYHY